MPAPPALDANACRDEVPRPTGGRLNPVLRMLNGGDARIRTVGEPDAREGAVRQRGDVHTISLRDGTSSWTTCSTRSACTTQIVDIVEQTDVLLQRGREVEEGWNARWPGYEMVDYEERPYTGAEMPVHWVTRITELSRVGSSYLTGMTRPWDMCTGTRRCSRASLHSETACVLPRRKSRHRQLRDIILLHSMFQEFYFHIAIPVQS
ncbi:hypothetical protein C8J57DRAFT_274083 [Mycena rebaudengoi]|nr:hypothetical protein C8J57DRAFT_274083 [Mycena rebaudengoi]